MLSRLTCNAKALNSISNNLSTIRLFSSSPAVFLSKSEKKTKSVEKKKKNIAFKTSKEANKDKVDPVLGKANNPFIIRLQKEITDTNVLIKGYKLDDVDKLLYGAKEIRLQKSKESMELTSDAIDSINSNEIEKRDILLRILTLRNADNSEKQKRLVELAMNEFQRFEGDTGSSEVQAAVMTIEIYNLVNHIKSNPQDLLHIRKVRMLTQKRQKILRYLKRDEPQRYFWTIAKLGLTDDNIHSEFNMDKKYMDEFNIWPGRELVKVNKKDNEIMKKQRRMKKQAIRKALQEISTSKKESVDDEIKEQNTEVIKESKQSSENNATVA